MRDNGKMIYNMEGAKKPGQMDQFMRVTIWEERSMGLESTVGMMALHTKATGTKIRLKGLGHINGWMGEAFRALGLTIIWTELAFTGGLTVAPMRESILMTRRMVTASTHGLTSGSIPAGGSEASSMEWAPTMSLSRS